MYHIVEGDAVRCPPLMYLSNTIALPYDNEVGSKATLKCTEDHIFADGQLSKIIQCVAAGIWTPELLTGCEGIQHVI